MEVRGSSRLRLLYRLQLKGLGITDRDQIKYISICSRRSLVIEKLPFWGGGRFAQLTGLWELAMRSSRSIGRVDTSVSERDFAP